MLQAFKNSPLTMPPSITQSPGSESDSFADCPEAVSGQAKVDAIAWEMQRRATSAYGFAYALGEAFSSKIGEQAFEPSSDTKEKWFFNSVTFIQNLLYKTFKKLSFQEEEQFTLMPLSKPELKHVVTTSMIELSEPDLILLSYNIDTNAVRTEEGYAREAFPEWRAKERILFLESTLLDLIDLHHPDVIHLQEGRKYITKFGDQVDSVTALVAFLEAKHYQVIVHSYNDTGDKAFKFITAFDPAKFTLEKFYLKYLTKTPDAKTIRPTIEGKTAEEITAIQQKIREHNFGAEWERGVLVVHLKNRLSQKNLYAINVHLDIQFATRRAAMDCIVNIVTKIKEDEPDAEIAISGDFNTISNWGAAEQLAIIEQAIHNGRPLLQEATKQLKLLDGTLIDSSFIAYPYDFAANEKRLNLNEALTKIPPLQRREKIIDVYDKECDSLGSKLDRVYSAGFSSSEALLIPAVVSPVCLASYEEQKIKQYVVAYTKEKGTPAFASDHQPVLVKFKK